MSRALGARTAERLTFAVAGLDAAGGRVARSVEHALIWVGGVTRVYVNPNTGMAYVEFDPALTSQDQVIAAVERAGPRIGEIRRH